MSVVVNPQKPNADFYGDDFYADQIRDSERSARHYLTYLWSIFQPTSVTDVGCGRGAWLKVFAELGARDVIGYDGAWNSQSQMIDSRIRFFPVDLEKTIVGSRTDMAMSLEVAEHLSPQASDRFVKSLVGLSDTVLFAAAFTNQGGTNHVNERPHSFWARKFELEGFAVFDLFRPRFWGNEEVCSWYRQNTFLYVRRASDAFEGLRTAGFAPMASLDFLDCVHPYFFFRPTPSADVPGVRDLAKNFFPALRRAVLRRAGRLRAK